MYKANNFAHISVPFNPTEMVLYSKFTSWHVYQNNIIQVELFVENKVTMAVLIRSVLVKLAFLRHQGWVKKATKRLNNQGG